MLRVVPELRDIKVPIPALEQVGLRATAHVTKKPCCVDRHVRLR
jgi:hypothetical protein